MEKRNTILLTVIAIATLLVAVAGATFAYFAGTTRTTNFVDLNVTTEAANSVFDTLGDTIAFNVTADKMQVSSPKTVVATDDATLTVTYLSGVATNTNCTYNVYYQWQSPNNVYTITEAGTNEFTYQVEGSTGTFNVAETNFVAGSTTTAQKLNGDTKITIANASATEATTQTYHIIAKFYNIDKDQSANAGKTFKIKFFVNDVVC